MESSEKLERSCLITFQKWGGNCCCEHNIISYKPALTTSPYMSTKGIDVLLVLLYSKTRHHALPEFTVSCY